MELSYYRCYAVEVNTLKQSAVNRIVDIIGSNMREIDELECRADGTTPKQAVKDSILCSDICYILAYKNRPFVVMGASIDHCIWALGTDEAEKHKRALVKCGIDFIALAKEKFGYLYNFISKRNQRALRFITFAGAQLYDEVDVNGEPFILFVIPGKGETECVV